MTFAVGPALTAVLGVLSIPLFAWSFSPDDLGRNNVLQVVIGFTTLLFVLGLDQAFVREFHESNDTAALFTACVLPSLAAAGLTTLAALPFSAKISMFLYGESEERWFAFTVVCAVGGLIGRFLCLILRMQERGYAYSVSQVLPKLVVIVTVASLAIRTSPLGYTELLYANVASTACLLLYLAWSLRLSWSKFFSARTKPADVVRLLRFGFPLVGAGLAFWGLGATSTVALREYSTFHELGIYAMSMSIAGIAMVLQAIFTTVWMPIVYKWLAAGRDLSEVVSVNSIMLALVCVAFAFAGTFSWVTDYFLPPAYSQVKYIVICCMAQPLLYTLSETTVVGLNIHRKSLHSFGVSVMALGVNATLGYLLVPHFGAAGAATANASAFMVFFTGRTALGARFLKVADPWKTYGALLPLLGLAILTALRGDLWVGYSTYWAMALGAVLFCFRQDLMAAYKKAIN